MGKENGAGNEEATWPQPAVVRAVEKGIQEWVMKAMDHETPNYAILGLMASAFITVVAVSVEQARAIGAQVGTETAER